MFSKAPQVLGQFDLCCPEMMFIQYLPLKMANSPLILTPDNLKWIEPLYEEIICEFDDYVYVTAKCMYQTQGDSYNRLGFHIDGYGTEDINYVWSDCNPTEFYVQEFNLPDDHEGSMKAMAEQALCTAQVIHPPLTLLRLDNTMVHRVSPYGREGMRTFVKLSVSKNKYALKGNAHNYLFDYDWKMVDRNVERNCPQGLK